MDTTQIDREIVRSSSSEEKWAWSISKILAYDNLFAPYLFMTLSLSLPLFHLICLLLILCCPSTLDRLLASSLLRCIRAHPITQLASSGFYITHRQNKMMIKRKSPSPVFTCSPVLFNVKHFQVELLISIHTHCWKISHDTLSLCVWLRSWSLTLPTCYYYYYYYVTYLILALNIILANSN